MYNLGQLLMNTFVSFLNCRGDSVDLQHGCSVKKHFVFKSYTIYTFGQLPFQHAYHFVLDFLSKTHL